MLGFLLSKPGAKTVPEGEVESRYYAMRMQALFGVFIGYVGYYLVRSNFTLSTPYLMKALQLTKTDIGLLSSAMLITYGISKGLMSSLADKCNPKYYMAFGLLLSSIVNFMLGFSTAYWMFVALVVVNGLVQGMGVGPSFITIANWFPRMQRGRTGAIWNISHNIGGGLVAPIATGAFAMFGAEHWQIASYTVPAVLALIIAVIVIFGGLGTPYNEGMPPLEKILKDEEKNSLVSTKTDHAPDNMTPFQIFVQYALKSKHVWYVSMFDAFVYLVRFGVITWLPIYLLQVKGFTKGQMGMAFAIFEWAAIPATLVAGVLTDKYLKGRRMPVAIGCLMVILGALFFYWSSNDLIVVTAAAGAIGAFIYVPQFLASVVTMEVVPSFAVGSAVGLRGFMSYIVGTTMGTALIGKLVDLYGWSAGFYTLLTGAVLAIVFGVLSHLGSLELEAKKQADLAKADTLDAGDVATAGARA